MADLDTLLHFAARVAQFPGDANAASNLVLRLQLCIDIDMLRSLASRFPFDPAVAVPVWRRIAALSAEDPITLVEAGYALYTHGLDEAAASAAASALASDETFIPAWELKAALTPDPADRHAIYEQILKIEPGNRTAVDHLIIMGRPKS